MSVERCGTSDWRTNEWTRRSTADRIPPRDAPAETDVAEAARVDLGARDEHVDPATHLLHLLDDPVLVRRLETTTSSIGGRAYGGLGRSETTPAFASSIASV